MSQVMSERVYCSDLCLQSGEPLLGTAPEVDVWLLLEYQPVWKAKATEDNDLAAPTQRWLERMVAAFAATGRTARPQFIRRPERPAETASVSLHVAHDGKLARFQGSSYNAVTELDFNSLDRLDGNHFTALEEPRYFVCTNGQRDLCCARYGLPVYTRLRELVGERVWQTTHVGGHRFAPNVLVLPQGALYGRVFADDVDDFAATVEAGQLSLPHLRGRSAYPPAAQVAETRVTDAHGVKGIDGELVTFQTADGGRTVRVRQAEVPFEVIASCGKDETETVYPFLLD